MWKSRNPRAGHRLRDEEMPLGRRIFYVERKIFPTVGGSAGLPT
jgi:hypothetical protein